MTEAFQEEGKDTDFHEMFVSTLLDAPTRFSIKNHLGVAHGSAIRRRIARENSKKTCNDARTEAHNGMVEVATEMGADGVLGMRYYFNTIVEDDAVYTEVLCYGTCVALELVVNCTRPLVKRRKRRRSHPHLSDS